MADLYFSNQCCPWQPLMSKRYKDSQRVRGVCVSVSVCCVCVFVCVYLGVGGCGYIYENTNTQKKKITADRGAVFVLRST